MEMVKDEAFKEINAIKARITDQDVVAFADNFLLALDVKITYQALFSYFFRKEFKLERKSWKLRKP